jgi:septum formation protein
LLAALGLPFDVVAADVDESVVPGEDAAAAAVRLARSKAEAVAWREWDAIVLGADTVVVLDGRILGKPADADEAAAMLRDLRDREHTVITGVAVVDSRSGDTHTAAPATTVRMRRYADAEIAASIAAGTPFDKAGAYAIQDDAFSPVACIAGCYCNVVGLPLWTVHGLLSDLAGGLALRPPSANRTTCASCPMSPA